MIYPEWWASQYSVVYKTGWWKIAQFQPDAWLCGSSSPCFIGIIPQQFWPDKPAKTDQIRKKALPNSWLQINHYFSGTDYGSYRNSSWSVLNIWIMAQMMQMKVQLAAVRWSSTSPIDDLLLPSYFHLPYDSLFVGYLRYDRLGLLGCRTEPGWNDRPLAVPCFFWVIYGSNNGSGKSE